MGATFGKNPLRGYPLRTYVKFSEKLTFRVRIRRLIMLVSEDFAYAFNG